MAGETSSFAVLIGARGQKTVRVNRGEETFNTVLVSRLEFINNFNNRRNGGFSGNILRKILPSSKEISLLIREKERVCVYMQIEGIERIHSKDFFRNAANSRRSRLTFPLELRVIEVNYVSRSALLRKIRVAFDAFNESFYINKSKREKLLFMIMNGILKGILKCIESRIL